MSELESKISELVKDQSGKGSKPAPVELWNPDLSGDIDIVVKRDGRWFHEGSEIKRAEIVKIFSNILKLENDEYFLLTPVEKWRIQVEDAPFVVVSVDLVTTEGRQGLQCKTITGEQFVIGADHPLSVEYRSGQDGEPSPYVLVRTNLKARINRNVFYQLVDMAETVEEGSSSKMIITSLGQSFVLGEF